MHRALLIGFLCAVLPALYPDAPLAADDLGKQHVLVLNSYNRGYKWTDSETEGILDVFAPHPGVMLRIEYMDAKILNTDDYYQRLRDLYALKYRDHEFDAVISTDDDALFFLKKYRDELFGERLHRDLAASVEAPADPFGDPGHHPHGERQTHAQDQHDAYGPASQHEAGR